MNETACPRCRKAPLRRRIHHLTGDIYYLCENFPDCRFVSYMDDMFPDDPTPVRSTPVA